MFLASDRKPEMRWPHQHSQISAGTQQRCLWPVKHSGAGGLRPPNTCGQVHPGCSVPESPGPVGLILEGKGRDEDKRVVSAHEHIISFSPLRNVHRCINTEQLWGTLFSLQGLLGWSCPLLKVLYQNPLWQQPAKWQILWTTNISFPETLNTAWDSAGCIYTIHFTSISVPSRTLSNCY